MEVTFCPQKIKYNRFKLLCYIFDLKNDPVLMIPMAGQVTIPLIHFELPNDHTPLNKSFDKIINIRSKGIDNREMMSFDTVNPTDTSYEYMWECLDVSI